MNTSIVGRLGIISIGLALSGFAVAQFQTRTLEPVGGRRGTQAIYRFQVLQNGVNVSSKASIDINAAVHCRAHCHSMDSTMSSWRYDGIPRNSRYNANLQCVEIPVTIPTDPTRDNFRIQFRLDLMGSGVWTADKRVPIF